MLNVIASEAKQSRASKLRLHRDCFVATLLAMTPSGSRVTRAVTVPNRGGFP